MIYFDNAATTLRKPISVYEAVNEAMQTCASVGRSGHTAARRAAELTFACRQVAGDMFHVLPDQVVFTLNATHSLNIAIFSLISPGDKVVVSGFEHNAVLRPLHHLGAELIVAGRSLFRPEQTVDAFRSALENKPKAVVCTHVSNVFGYVLPLEEIAALCRERGVPLIVDAAQSAGVLPLSLKELGASFIAMPGHKALYGPQGTGMLLCSKSPKPILYGGTGSQSQSREMPRELPDLAEPGTHNVPGIAGLKAGMEWLSQQGTNAIQKQEAHLIGILQNGFRKLDHIRGFYGDPCCQTGVFSFTVDTMDCEVVSQRLSDAGIAVRAGLHCAPLAHESAGTLQCGTVRVSVSAFNSEAEAEVFLATLQKILNA